MNQPQTYHLQPIHFPKVSGFTYLVYLSYLDAYGEPAHNIIQPQQAIPL